MAEEAHSLGYINSKDIAGLVDRQFLPGAAAGAGGSPPAPRTP